jgi:hypothetical protein
MTRRELVAALNNGDANVDDENQPLTVATPAISPSSPESGRSGHRTRWPAGDARRAQRGHSTVTVIAGRFKGCVS